MTSIQILLDPRFITDYIPEDVVMTAIMNWIVEEGVKFMPSEDSHVGCQNTEGSQGITQEEPVHKRRKLSKHHKSSLSQKMI